MQGVVKPLSARRKIGSIRVGFRLIRALEARGRPMSLTELAKTVGMPAIPSALHVGALMAEHLWISHRIVAAAAVQVGLAHAARHYADQHLVEARRAQFRGVDDEGGRRPADNGGLDFMVRYGSAGIATGGLS